ncbi:RTA1-like protein [Panaeolus papilionaceus]|nr:RTA1-like protein [Panaeolus papilionaceus]
MQDIDGSGMSPAQIAAWSPYGYIPSRNIAIIFMVLYGLSTVTHIAQAVRYRQWWLYPTICLCGLLEVTGWGARLWSSFYPLKASPFQMQICLTVLGPTPLLAANFIILGEMIKYLGPSYSRVSPRMYAIVFCTCDFISLIAQGVGGGLAATAITLEAANQGSHIMLGGIVFQLFVIVVYSTCAFEFLVRHLRDVPFSPSSRGTVWEKKSIHLLTEGRRESITRNLKIMGYGLMFNTTTLFVRAIYRTIELEDGWRGRIILNELYFNILDGAMIVLAIYTLNIVHPGVFLEKVQDVHEKDESASSQVARV